MSFIDPNNALASYRGGREGFKTQILQTTVGGGTTIVYTFAQLEFVDAAGTHFDVAGQSDGTTNLVTFTPASTVIVVPNPQFDNGGADDGHLRYVPTPPMSTWFQVGAVISAFPDGVNDDIVLGLALNGNLLPAFRQFWSGQTRNACGVLCEMLQLAPNDVLSVVFGNMSSAVRGVSLTSLMLSTHQLI